MLETLVQWDTAFFYAVNHGTANHVFDWVMPLVTEVKHYYPLYVLLFAWLIFFGGKKGRWAAVLLIVTVLITDPLNSRFLKEEVARLRPCDTLPDVRLLIENCAGGKSFPSSHAVNNFAGVVVLGHFYPRAGWIWLGIALLIIFSRIYIGVHYPVDVLGGALVGAFVGGCVVWAWEGIRRIGRR